MKSKHSRLQEVQVTQTKRSFILNLIGIIVVLFLLFKFGLPMLINITSFITSRNTGDDTQTKTKSFVASPVLNSLPDATNKNTTTISGSGPSDVTIVLYINHEKRTQTSSNSNGSFSFTDVTLQKGPNTIQAKAIAKDKSESELSKSMTIVYNDKKPDISIDQPTDGQSFSQDQNSVTVTGKTNPEVTVTVNDFRAIVDSGGNYSYNLPLKQGDNEIKVVATDAAGNTSDKTIKVVYSP